MCIFAQCLWCFPSFVLLDSFCAYRPKTFSFLSNCIKIDCMLFSKSRSRKSLAKSFSITRFVLRGDDSTFSNWNFFDIPICINCITLFVFVCLIAACMFFLLVFPNFSYLSVCDSVFYRRIDYDVHFLFYCVCITFRFFVYLMRKFPRIFPHIFYFLLFLHLFDCLWSKFIIFGLKALRKCMPWSRKTFDEICLDCESLKI